MMDRIMVQEKHDNYNIERGKHMFRILICDDDPVFLEFLRQEVRLALKRTSIQAAIQLYQGMDDIPDELLRNCDIAFLDVDFSQEKYTGIDIARKIRLVQRKAIIIFVTNYIEYAPEGYEVQAFRYILKSEVRTKLDRCLNDAVSNFNTVQETFQINVSGEIINIPIEDILYIESNLHTIIVYVQKREQSAIKDYTCYASISAVEEQLVSKGFLRIHKSYLVNMRHIRKYQCHEALLFNGTVLRVSEKNYAKQKKKYLLWKGMN